MSRTRQVLALSAALLAAGVVSTLPDPARPPPGREAPGREPATGSPSRSTAGSWTGSSTRSPSGPGRDLAPSGRTSGGRMGAGPVRRVSGPETAAAADHSVRVATGVGGRPVPVRVRGTPSSAAASTPRWRWPLDRRVLRRFEAPTSPWGPGHRGLDLAANDGDEVRAVEAGTVTHAGVLAGRGTVTVRHHDGLRSTYEPVAVRVSEGDTVLVGDVLGSVEATGGHCGSSACLHLGAVGETGYLDPWPLLVGGRVRLLPLMDP